MPGLTTTIVDVLGSLLGFNIETLAILLALTGFQLYRSISIGTRLSTMVWVGSMFLIGLAVLAALNIVELQPGVAMRVVDVIVGVADAVLDAVLGGGGGEST